MNTFFSFFTFQMALPTVWVASTETAGEHSGVVINNNGGIHILII